MWGWGRKFGEELGAFEELRNLLSRSGVPNGAIFGRERSRGLGMAQVALLKLAGKIQAGRVFFL